MKLRDDVKAAQKRMYEILIIFDKICKKYDLVYWLDFGTLLGAVRHKGFIPWDDDLDVSMPRKDYEKFLKIASKELPEDLFLQTQQTDKYYQNFFAKIRDRKSTFIDAWEEKRDIKYHQGIYIDIFPVNFIVDNEIVVQTYKALIFFSKFVHNRYIKSVALAKPFVKLLNSFHKENAPLIVSGGENMHYITPIKKENFFPLSEIRFEGEFFPAPKDPHMYLKLVFGDSYMQLPPEEKRRVHSVRILSDIPCDYEKQFLK